jgi:chaperone BCS1
VLVGITKSDDVPTSGTPSQTPPNSVTDVVAFLFSFAALRDWLKLILIGGTLEALRRFAMYTYESFVNCLWVTAYFDQDDSSYSMQTFLYRVIGCLSFTISQTG